MFNTAVGGHIMERFEHAECEEMFESFAQAEQQSHFLGLLFLMLDHPPHLLESAFHDLKHTVEDIAKSLKDRQGGPCLRSNTSVMAVSVRSVGEKEVAEDDPYSSVYSIQSPEEVDEEKIVEVPAEKAEEEEKGAGMKAPEIDLTSVPYPACLLPFKQAREHGKFLDMFKKVKVNLPLIETLQSMPKHAKFLKDLLSNKKKLEEVSKVSLSEQCFAVVQNKLPGKFGASGRFTIPCLPGSFPLHHALGDLGASINMMPYFLYKQLDLG
ncbi:hypothetical protein L1987_83315 [Smallanthus sonchifolius]|uniref:Uncharacterized protein n=1 Tax=Smallanthus sonchifolius TaxID=185202 RepID=A0ACB8YG37_9ASTR|nr:hypothetical protein L1987_83315 [Smallanthus sonchifolius]